jgi:flagellar biosynthetic protein FlhB
MAMSEGDLDRNEDATPHKLAEARKRGQVAKSADIVSSIVFMVGAVLLYAKGWDGLVALFKLDHRALAALGAASDPSAARLIQLSVRVLDGGLQLLLPGLGFVLVAAILSNVGQTGPLWSWHPLTPDLQRINPMTGFKRVFSLRTLFDALRAVIKLVVLSVVVAASLWGMLPSFVQLGDVTPYGQAGLLIRDLAALALRIALALLLIASLDFIFSNREFAKKMRMSRKEMRDESKNREGDPRIRARLRELRREMLKRSKAIRRTAEADIVITNPTHIAVALRYRHGEMAAPVVVSKGAGMIAQAIRFLAARHKIPVLRSPSLARALHATTPLDSPIPTHLYPGVARLLVWVLSLKSPASQKAKGSVR